MSDFLDIKLIIDKVAMLNEIDKREKSLANK